MPKKKRNNRKKRVNTTATRKQIDTVVNSSEASEAGNNTVEIIEVNIENNNSVTEEKVEVKENDLEIIEAIPTDIVNEIDSTVNEIITNETIDETIEGENDSSSRVLEVINDDEELLDNEELLENDEFLEIFAQTVKNFQEQSLTENKITDDTDTVESPIDDDEAIILAGDSKKLHGEPGFEVIAGLENIITWKIHDFYEADGSVTKNYRSLRKEPPTFIVESSDGESVVMTVTKDFAQSMAKTFTEISSVYNGKQATKPEHKPVTKKDIEEKFKNFILWIRSHPLKFTSILIILGFIVWAVV